MYYNNKMDIKKILVLFWYGKIKLWKAFWVIGILHALLLNYSIPLIEKYIFNKENIFIIVEIQNFAIPVLDFIKIHFISKIILIFSTLFITIGIWRSAENYTGNFMIILLTLSYLSFNNLLPTIKFIFLTLFV